MLCRLELMKCVTHNPPHILCVCLGDLDLLKEIPPAGTDEAMWGYSPFYRISQLYNDRIQFVTLCLRALHIMSTSPYNIH